MDCGPCYSQTRLEEPSKSSSTTPLENVKNEDNEGPGYQPILCPMRSSSISVRCGKLGRMGCTGLLCIG